MMSRELQTVDNQVSFFLNLVLREMGARPKEVRREVTPSSSCLGTENSESSQQIDATAVNERPGNSN